MKALIIDPAVHSLGGHHFNAVQRLQGELAGLGVAAPCLGSAYADRRVVEELSLHADIHAVGVRADLHDAWRVRRQRRGDRPATGRGDAPVGHARSHHPAVLRSGVGDGAGTTAEALLVAAAAAHPAVAALRTASPQDTGRSASAADLDGEARAAFAELAANAGGVGAYCETPAMADFYRGLVPFEVGVMPGPGLPARARAIRAAGGPPVVSCIGFANRAKGYRLLPQAMRHVLDRHRDVRFMIHGIVKGSDAEADQPMFDRLAALGERVEVRQEVLTSDEYLARLAEADLLLLPYDPDVYRRRGSGVFADAHHVGIPVVAPKDCAFARPAFDDGWGVAMTEYDGKSLGIAVLEALDRLAPLSACAAQAAGRVRDDLSRVLGASVEGLAGRPAGLAGLLRRFRPGNAPRIRLSSARIGVHWRQLW